MHLLGIFLALGAGLFFGILAPMTKIAYNLGVGVGLAIILRYFVRNVCLQVREIMAPDYCYGTTFKLVFIKI